MRAPRSVTFAPTAMPSRSLKAAIDFRGLNARSFDGRGNYSLGVREQVIFPEIDYDSVASVRGFDITITTSAATDEQALALLRSLGLPFVRAESQEGSA